MQPPKMSETRKELRDKLKELKRFHEVFAERKRNEPNPGLVEYDILDIQDRLTRRRIRSKRNKIAPVKPAESLYKSQPSAPNVASDAALPPPPPPVIASEAKPPAMLLTEIQQGTNLRKVDKALNQNQTKSLTETLLQAMDARRRSLEMQEGASQSDTSNDDDWN